MTTTPPPALRVGMIGHAFMGAMHSHAWRTAPRFFDLPLTPELAVIAGRNPASTAAAAAKYGWAESTTNWRELIERDDIDLIDICTPGDTHREIALAALAAGKHVLCEKPLANTVAEAEEMTAAAEDAASRGVFSMCGFTYRRTPALTLARQLVAEGRLGTVRQVRAQYLQDWLSDENAPMTWRLDKTKSGSGSLGDIGAHIIDAAQYVTGTDIAGVSAVLETFVTRRPVGGEHVGLGGSGATDGEYAEVTVDDAALFTARFTDNTVGIFEATRFALGRKNAVRLEINGTLGSLAFDFEDMNVLEFFDGTAPAHTQGFQRIIVTEPVHPYTANWWPAGHGLGYEHGFTHQVVDLVTAIGAGTSPTPSFRDALGVQRVLDAVERSSADHSIYTPVSR
ncbi:Gfo/Idh/MocA family protein [Mycetocola sp. JXN-3]|uniref:Gfo/Idh/MocA family protein n=1 Tax=Mycetocola sp. JXN-3 TaxID=2116510 RepID=UPI00165D0007|nr:Gfo/Idh/MocA family oxidoreductase [Mycetocola sp. JXN-3]